jgi:hypothetical protein
MNIVISIMSDKPIYQQLFEQISAQIIKGELEKDFCLPPIRTVAKELRISVITVKKAWEGLERRGFIYKWLERGVLWQVSCRVSGTVCGMRWSSKNWKKILRIIRRLGFRLRIFLSSSAAIMMRKAIFLRNY